MARLAYPAIAMAAILLVGLAFQPLHATHPHKVSPKTPTAQVPTVSILLNGFVNGWNFSTNPNPGIPARVGDLVSLNLVSSDTALHLFIVDVDRDGSTTANCPTVDPCSAGFTTRTTYNFTVSFGLGTYTYYCAIHPTTMLGSFVVIGSPGDAGGGHRVVL